MLQAKCAACNASIKAPEQLAGTQQICPRCGNSVDIPIVPAAVSEERRKPPLRKKAQTPRPQRVTGHVPWDRGRKPPLPAWAWVAIAVSGGIAMFFGLVITITIVGRARAIAEAHERRGRAPVSHNDIKDRFPPGRVSRTSSSRNERSSPRKPSLHKDVQRTLRPQPEPVKAPESISAALDYLQSREVQKQEHGLAYLKNSSIDEDQRDNVVDTVLAQWRILHRRKPDVAIAVLKRWATAEHASKIVTAMTSNKIDATEGLSLLQGLKDAKTISHIIPFLKDRSKAGDLAEDILRDFDEAAKGALVPHLYDPNQEMRDRVARLLKNMDEEWELLFLKEAAKNLRAEDAESREAAIDYIIAEDVNEDFRPQVTAGLGANLNHDDPQVVNKAVTALKTWNGPEATAGITQAFESKAIRADVALELLAKTKDPQAATALAAMLENPFEAGKQAEAALREIGPKAARALLPYLNDRSKQTRQRVRALLAEFEADPEAQLKQTLEDLQSPDDQRRWAAAEWLAEAPSAVTKNAEHQKAVIKLLPKLENDSNRFVQIEVPAIFARWAGPEDAGKLLEMADSFLRKEGNIALKRLVELQHPKTSAAIAERLSNFIAREKIVPILCEMPEAEPFVIPCLVSKDAKAVIAATRILGQVGTQESVKPLQATISKARELGREDVAQIAQTQLELVTQRVADQKNKK